MRRPIRSVIILVIKQIGTNFVIHSYDYRSNWTPLSPNTIINREAVVEFSFSSPVKNTYIYLGRGGDSRLHPATESGDNILTARAYR